MTTTQLLLLITLALTGVLTCQAQSECPRTTYGVRYYQFNCPLRITINRPSSTIADNSQTCFTVYRKPGVTCGTTRCYRPANFRTSAPCNAATTAHAQAYCTLYGNLPSTERNLVVSGSSIAVTYTSSTNTFTFNVRGISGTFNNAAQTYLNSSAYYFSAVGSRAMGREEFTALVNRFRSGSSSVNIAVTYTCPVSMSSFPKVVRTKPVDNYSDDESDDHAVNVHANDDESDNNAIHYDDDESDNNAIHYDDDESDNNAINYNDDESAFSDDDDDDENNSITFDED